jgi:hypothetical protein
MIIDELFEAPQQCPECGGISFSDLILAEKKDACYHKVKASAKVWPSAYASGRLVQCRKKGAANYGNKSEGVAEGSLDDSNFGKSAALMTPTPQAAQQARDIVQQRADDNVISQAKIAGAVPITREGEQQPGADYRDPKEVDYDGEYDAMVARVKRLAGLGPMKTVYDPKKRQYRNMPTAQQPKK